MTTDRLLVPEIISSQAQKEVTHNEALRFYDPIIAGSVQDRTLTAPPGSPTDGFIWIPAATATGPWADKENTLAHRYKSAWYFYVMPAEFIIYSIGDGSPIKFNGSSWGLSGQSGGKLFKTITTATTLTNAEVGQNVMQFGGSLGSTTVITLPSGVEKHWAVMNGSGATLQFEVSGQGFTIDVTNGARKMLVSDGTSVFDANV